MECLGRYTFFVMSSVILSGGVKMSVEHGMLREVYISCHDFQPDRYILLVPKLYNVSRGVVQYDVLMSGGGGCTSRMQPDSI